MIGDPILFACLVLVVLVWTIVCLYARSMSAAQKRASLAEQVLQSASAAILVLDDRGCIIHLNRAAENLFRIDPKRAAENTFSTLLEPQVDRQTTDVVSRIVGGTGNGLEWGNLLGRCIDGTVFPMQLRCRQLTFGPVRRTVVVARDLTPDKTIKNSLQRYVGQLVMAKDALQRQNLDLESKIEERTEQLRSAKEAADQANASKGEFLANMSHELRTPLHGILSFARLGLRRSETLDREKLLMYFQRIEASGNTLLYLLNQLLDLSKLEAHAMELRLGPVDCALVISEVLDAYSALLRERDLNLEVRHDAAASMVLGDRERLAQVFRNLLNNAIKFTPAGGSIRVTTCDANEMLTVSIQDTGPGIPDDECARVFEKFTQSKLTSSGAGGTGLGLSICREIVLLHQGSIWAEPTHGQGALLRVCLPRLTAAHCQPETDAESVSSKLAIA